MLPATPADHDHAGPTAQFGLPVWASVVLLVVTAVVAGAGLLRPLTGEPSATARKVVWSAAGFAVVITTGAWLLDAANPLIAVIHSTLALAVAMLLVRPLGALVGGALLTGMLVVEAMLAGSGSGSPITDGYLVAGLLIGVVTLLGIAVAVVTATTGSRSAPARRLAPVALVAIVVMAAAGVAQAVLPAPGARPHPGVPLLRDVELAGQRLPVLLTPQRPGRNLVFVGSSSGDVRVGADRDNLVAASERPGASGMWAVVELPAGGSEMWLERDGDRVPVAVDAGHGEPAPPNIAGPDGPECAELALGAALAGGPPELHSCPADTLADDDEASLRELVGFLAGRGVRSLAVATDSSARSTAAAAAVREAAERRQLTIEVTIEVTTPQPHGALVVVSGWTAATTTLTQVAEQQRIVASFTAGVYLAPWLLSASVIRASSGTVIPLRFNPRDEQPAQYEIALSNRLPGHHATVAGYRGWLAAKGINQPSGTRLYAASLVSVMPAELAHDHGSHSGWLPGGTVVAVTGPLDEH